jgi:hypothetical protein
VTAAVGLGVPKSAEVTLRPEQGWAAVWQGTDGAGNGQLGIGLAAPRPAEANIRQEGDTALLLQPATSDHPVVYYAGAGWTKYGFPDAAAWNAYMIEFARRLASPLEILW